MTATRTRIRLIDQMDAHCSRILIVGPNRRDDTLIAQCHRSRMVVIDSEHIGPTDFGDRRDVD